MTVDPPIESSETYQTVKHGLSCLADAASKVGKVLKTEVKSQLRASGSDHPKP